MRNYVVNSRYRQASPSPIRIANGGAWVANKFWIGSGAGGDCTVNRVPFVVGQTAVPGNPEWFLRCQWTTAPAEGEAQYKPQCRWTWLEHHMYQARELVGSLVYYAGALRVQSGTVYVQPVFWINYADGDYLVVDGAGVTVGEQWTHVSGAVRLPQYPFGKVLDSGHYVGFGYDFTYQTAPTIEVAPIAIWAPSETIDNAHYWTDSQESLQP